MFKILYLVFLSVTGVWSANILHVSMVPSPSHHIWNRALAFGLAKKGHNVTLMGPDKDKIMPENYTHLYTEGVYEAFHEDLDMLGMAENTPTQTILEFIDFCHEICSSGYKSKGLRQLLDYPPDYKFDAIILDVTLGGCFSPLIHKFNYPPTVAVTPFLLPPYMAYDFGNHLYPAYVPWYGLPYTNDMTFMERLWNTFFMYSEVFLKIIQQKRLEHEEAKKVLGHDIPSVRELERHTSLVLTNSDPVLDYPQPMAPHFIQVGGLHTRKSKDIPQDLLKVLDGAKNGVIVFSLGSNIRSDMLDKGTQKALLDAFSQLKEVVIWKFESDIENLPKNVIVRKWLPQNDILGHPKVKLFIGHGGCLSTQEAIFHGVPIICVPFFFDQHVNTRSIINRKMGISLDYKKISTPYVLQKIREVLDNPIYLENMRRISSAFRDRLETPLQRAIFWVEYVIRHGGAQFLSSPARDMPFYKAAGLDVLAFVLVVLVAICLVISKAVKQIFALFGPKGKLKRN